jgi:trimethylamine--corrinoid protein Co-methyltransferase
MFEPENAPRVLSAERIDSLHAQAVRILQEVGLEVLYEPARDLLAAQGQKVEGTRVRFDGEWVMEMVRKAPSEFTVTPRNPERAIHVGGGSRVLLPVGGSPFASDLDSGRRPGSIADHDSLVKMAHSADVIGCLQSATVEAVELPVPSRHMDMDYSVIRHSDKPYIIYGASGPKARDGLGLAAIWRGGREALEASPAVFLVVNPNSPLVWDERMVDALIASAEAGQPVVVTPFVLAGATAPVSAAGALSIQIAEALSGTAIAQAVRPGAPCLFGSFFTPLDMRTGAPAFGMPEGVLATLAGGQLARHYDLPYRGGGGLASGNSVDAQTASESLNTLWATFMSSSDFVLHAAGWLEGGLTASFEKFALDIEILRQLELIAKGLGFSQEEMAFDAVAEMGPGGLYLQSPHTMAHFREWIYMSPLFTTEDNAAWVASGSETLDRKANRSWKSLLESWEDPGIDPALDEELRDFISRRKEQLESDED